MSESTPLVSNGGSSHQQRSWNPWMDRAVTASIVLAIVLVFNFVISRNSDYERSNFTDIDEEGPSGVMYRPICQVHDSKLFDSVQVLQTSLTDASLHWWSPQECLQTKSPPRRYGAYDAVLNVNFSKLAHPNRPPILGFGGAFTEASALNFESLSEEGQNKVLELLFGNEGLGYTIGRTHINSCDFSVGSYAYDEVDGDFNLKHFSISHDINVGMMSMMQRAKSLLKTNWGDDLNLFASPWSPPSWMKAPTPTDTEDALHAENMTGSAQPICLRDYSMNETAGTNPYATAWALYFSKFLDEYAKHDLSFWAITIQNEPEFPAPWEACSYTKDTMADFLAKYLGPQLRETHPNVNILIFDHNKDHAPAWVDSFLNDETASQYVDGTAIHWYAGGLDRLLDGALGQPNLNRVMSTLDKKAVIEDHIVINSEACHCPTTGYAGGDVNIAWARAERYAHTILADLSAGAQGWVEWNLLLDSIGGPNHLNNVCDTTLLAVPHRATYGDNISPRLDFEHTTKFQSVGDDRTFEELQVKGMPADLIKLGIVAQPLFWYMGHISRYVRPGTRPVMALAEGNMAFWKDNIAGGGFNNLARDGIEITAWPCEGSTRQKFYFDNNQIMVKGQDWLGAPTTSCIAKSNDVDLLGIPLTSCNKTLDLAGTFDIHPVDDSGEQVQIVSIGEEAPAECLIIQKLANGGGAYGPRGGAQVALGSCGSPGYEDIWTRTARGEFRSKAIGNEVCMTTGWPFLQVSAFDNGVVVVLNEADQPANFNIRDDDRLILSASIPKHSIQTLLIET